MLLKSVKKLVIIIGLVGMAGTLAGCPAMIKGGTYNYSGPGNFQEFAKARLECAQQSRGRVESGGVYRAPSQYGGAVSGGYGSQVLVDCGIMDSCLAARGYRRNSRGNLDASSIAVQCQ